MSINRKFFFDHIRTELFGGKMTAAQVDGLTLLLDVWEADFWNYDDRILAHNLGTVFHETNQTMQPIREKGGRAYFIERYWKNLTIRKQLGNLLEEDAVERSGRGFVQLTGRSNDLRATIEIRKQCAQIVAAFQAETGQKFDLILSPAQALHPRIAVAVLYLGTIQGWFTGAKLTKFFNATTEKWVEARAVVNGTDKNKIIADFAKKFYAAISYTN